MRKGCPHWKSDILSVFEPRCQKPPSADQVKEREKYNELVEFARWTQTLWKNGIDIMRRNHLVIKSDDPMEKLAFTFYTDLCEIDSKAAHIFEEGYGDKNYKDKKVIPVDLSKYPTEQDIRKSERENLIGDIILELTMLDGHGEDNGKPLIALGDAQRLCDSLRCIKPGGEDDGILSGRNWT